MSKIFLILLMICSLNGMAQLPKSINIGYLENYEKLPKITFVKSNQESYDQCRVGKELAMLKVENTKNSFTLPVKKKKIKFKKSNPQANDFNGYEYLGYYKNLKMYAMTESTMSEGLSFSSFLLLDSLTEQYYGIVSIGDGAVNTPTVSPDGKHLIYYDNRVYHPNSCFIALLEMNRKEEVDQLFKEKMSYDTNSFAIAGIRWLDDHTFLIKAFSTKNRNGQREKEFNYYSASIN